MPDLKNEPVNTEINYSEQNKFQVVAMLFSIIGINVLLMLFIAFYWLDPAFHTFLTGNPL